MTDKPWKLVLLLVGIFVAGAITGGFVSLEVAHSMLRKRMAPETWGPARLKLLGKRLDLTQEQVARLEPIIKRDVEELRELREKGFTDAHAILERMERDIAALLTPEQKGKFEKLNAELRERNRRMMEQRRNERGEKGERRPRPDDHDHPPGPPPDGHGPGGETDD
jgi:Spy/CpxP family protein refolding chaperone